MNLLNKIQPSINETQYEQKTQLEQFRKMLERGHYHKAKELADNLTENGMPVTLINRVGYDIIRRGGAKRLAEIFKDYNWHKWLGENQNV